MSHWKTFTQKWALKEVPGGTRWALGLGMELAGPTICVSLRDR